MILWGKRRSLIDLIRTDLERDPREGPVVDAAYLKDACDLQDLAWMPTAEEPEQIDYGRQSSRNPSRSA